MGKKTLGLDLGPNSIGWALVDETSNRIIHLGVRVFPEGVDRDQQGGEQSKSQTRRTARGSRRQIARRSQRKRLLRYALQHAGLLPRDPNELSRVLAQNPYECRATALRGIATPYQLGRALFHISTRRGFLSNRKTDKGAETKGMLAEIGELASELTRRGETLGEYLAELDTNFEHAVSTTVEERDASRVRHRHTQRAMYEAEFEAIWQRQREQFPDVLTDELKFGTEGKQQFPTEPVQLRDNGELSADDRDSKLAARLLNQFGLHGLIFFQRKMYWPRSVIGQCELPSDENRDKQCKRKRCPKADRTAQYFRILQEVNNLKVDRGSGTGEESLAAEERDTIVTALQSTKQQTFDALRKKLNFTESMKFNFERGGRDKLKGNETDAAMASKRGVGPRWRKLDDSIRDRIVEICIFETREDVALRLLIDECGLSPEEAERASAAHLPDGYMHFCRHAIGNLIPHLERGLLLMANDQTDSALHAAGYLRRDERVLDQKDSLPPPPELPNPIVRQALFEVRKVVNAVIREYGKPDAIHIELAREAKKSFEDRREIRFDNVKRQRERSHIAERIVEEFSVKPSRNNINRYVLWEQQGEICMYCGETIAPHHIYTDETDVDHILPRWRSLDDSLANKLVVHRRCNRDKEDRTPREWLEAENPEQYERMLQNAQRLDYGKRQKLQQVDIQLDDFVARQLVDTTYISRSVKEYLECLGLPVVCPRGTMTKDLRHWWGLNNILDPEQRGRKNRGDHRHHSTDALVIALTDRQRLHALANARGENMPVPWPTFLEDARNAILSLKVSQKVQRRIAKALHKDTFYGPTNKPPVESDSAPRSWANGWVEDENTFVRRKPVEKIENTKHLAKVRDPAIRDILSKHLRKRGVDLDGKAKFPKGVFQGENTPSMPSGVPIKKVRMLEKSKTFRPASKQRSYQYVNPGNNHHIVYWAEGEEDDEKWSAQVVPMCDAAQRARSGLNPVDRVPPPGKRFVMSLSIGEMFEIVQGDGEIVLCTVRKLNQVRNLVFYKRHYDAREAGQIDKHNFYLSPQAMRQRNARKVTVDPLGRIRWAGD